MSFGENFTMSCYNPTFNFSAIVIELLTSYIVGEDTFSIR